MTIEYLFDQLKLKWQELDRRLKRLEQRREEDDNADRRQKQYRKHMHTDERDTMPS